MDETAFRKAIRQSSFVIRHSNRPFVAVIFAFLLGIAFSSICKEYWFGGLAVTCGAIICASLIALSRNRLTMSLALGLAAISTGGLLTGIAHRDGFPNSDLRSLLSQSAFPLDEPVSFDGCAVEESERRGEEAVTTVELRAFLRKDHWVPCKGKAILRIEQLDPENSGGQNAILSWGDRVRGWATWYVPRNFKNPGSADRAGLLARRGITIIGRVKSPRLLESIPGDCANPWSKLATAVRRRVRTSLDPIREEGKKQPAAILASLVIGDYSGLDNATREVFQNSGSFHVLVISGLHIAWISAALLFFFKVIHLPERISHLIVASVILLYTCVVGFQASITRCLWMFILYLIGRMLFRRADPVNILLASAVLLLAAQPDWLIEAGFQLTFLSVMAIVMTAAPAMDRYLKPLLEPLRHCGSSTRLFLQPGPWHRRGRKLRTSCELLVEEFTDTMPPAVSSIFLWLCRIMARAASVIGSMIVISLSVQIWVEPVLAYYFNRLSWISPLANLAIVPFSSLVLASGVAASLARDIPLFGPGFVRLAGRLSSGLLNSAACITMAPGAWQRCPTPLLAWVLAGVLLIFIWSFFEWRRFWIPCVYIILLLASLSCGTGTIPAISAGARDSIALTREANRWKSNSRILSFTFLDVGEGDCILISFPNKQLWICDAGGVRQNPFLEDSAYSFDIGEAVVSRYLWWAWVSRVDRLILSHTDLDHAGGIPAVIRNFKVARFDYSKAGADAILSGILDLAHKKRVNTNLMYAGMEEKLGEVNVRWLNPPMDSMQRSTNDSSIVLEFTFKRFSALLTGDLEKTGEAKILARPGALRGLLLKVAHHGSRSGTSDAFLDGLRPRWAAVSVGRNNPYGHPAREVLIRLLRHGARPILTLDEGAVSFETDGEHYEIKSYVSGRLEEGILK